MELHLSGKKGVPIQKGMVGLFFEDINYAADGGLYAEMIENRSFEFVDCYGTVGDYYTKPDPRLRLECHAGARHGPHGVRVRQPAGPCEPALPALYGRSRRPGLCQQGV